MGLWDADSKDGREFEVPLLWHSDYLDTYTEIVRSGAMLSFGLSRDGGAVSVSIMSSGRTVRKWAATADELDDLIAVFTRAAVAGELTPPATPDNKRRV